MFYYLEKLPDFVVSMDQIRRITSQIFDGRQEILDTYLRRCVLYVVMKLRGWLFLSIRTTRVAQYSSTTGVSSPNSGVRLLGGIDYHW